MQYLIQSPAKINLTLEIVKKRKDGFHNINSIMQTVSLYDLLKIKFKKNNNEIKILTSAKNIPTDENNLVYITAEKYLQKINKKIGLNINLKKNIPVGAGLGGGSSNAAAVLLGLNTYFKNYFSLKELQKIAESIGADVPYFLTGGLCFVSGKGEKVLPLNYGLNFYILIVFANIFILTKSVYQKIKKIPKLERLSLLIKKNIKSANLKEEKIISNLKNDLQPIVFKSFPQLISIKNKLLKLNASSVLMSGSGSAIFGIYLNKKDALNAKNTLQKNKKLLLTLVKPISKGVEIKKIWSK